MPKLSSHAGGQRGFSVAELAVTLCIFSILAGAAALMMGGLDNKEKLKGAQRAVFEILQETRVQAITRGTSWSVADTLTTAPFFYSDEEATLTTFVERAVKAENPSISVTPQNIAFNARGQRDTGDPPTVTISCSGLDDRTVSIQSSGLVKLD
ncbi:MAG: prepilin-type N-terminal cleavage/methylation domain-containing protein [Desulfobacterales bacterium]